MTEQTRGESGILSATTSRRGFLRNSLLAAGGVVAGGSLLAACGDDSSPSGGGGKGGKIYVADYGGLIQDATKKAIYDPFTKETGIEVVIVADPSFAKIQAMVDSGNVEWDLVSGSVEYVLGLGEKYFEKFPSSVFSVPGVNPDYMHPQAVGYYVFSQVNSWDTTKVDGTLSSWADFWDTGAHPGKRSLYGGDPPLEMALLADGVAIEDLYPLDVDRGFDALKKLSKDIPQYWLSGAQAAQLLSSGQVAATSLYAGTAVTLKEEGKNVDFSWNGGMIDPVQWIVPKGAPNKENAFKLAEYSVRADVQARFAKAYPIGPTNNSAYESLGDEVAKRLPTYPENFKFQFIRDIEWWAANRASITDRWTKFKVS